ncbi:MAG: glycosyltransferase family 4 protein [Bacillota bacterium]
MSNNQRRSDFKSISEKMHQVHNSPIHKNLKAVVIYPAELASPRATPTRVRLNIEAIEQNLKLEVIDRGGKNDTRDTWSLGEDKKKEQKGNAPSGFWGFTKTALRRLDEINPDAIHAVTTVAVLPAVLYKRRHPSVRVVFEMHGLSYYEQPELLLLKRLVLGFIDFWGARRADAVIAMSYTQRELIRKLYRVNPDKIRVLWGPVDLNLFYSGDPPPSRPFIIGYCGNDLFWQGLETVFEACRLLEAHPDIRFLLMGFPSERYASLGLHNATFIGPLTREETPSYMNRCHVLLSPRIAHKATETQYPFKLSAYLATGRPVIVTSVNDQPAVIEKAGCGMVIPPGDAGALANAILHLYRMTEAERLTLGRNARFFAENNFSVKHLGEELLNLCRHSN